GFRLLPLGRLQRAGEMLHEFQFRQHLPGRCAQMVETSSRRESASFDGADNLIVGSYSAIDVVTEFGKVSSKRDQSGVQQAPDDADFFGILRKFVLAPAAVHGL